MPTRFAVTLFGLFGLVLLAGAAIAEAPKPAWEGYWAANAAWCRNAGETGDETPDYYGLDGFFGIEWSCDIKGISATGYPNSWVVSLDCLDAGYVFQEQRLMLLNAYDRLLFLNDTGVTANLLRCEPR